jgi:hypothetical protein
LEGKEGKVSKSDNPIDESLAPEAKYSPAFFLNDLMGLITMFQAKSRLVGQLEFSDLQKAQIAGTLMMMGPAVQAFMNELKKWGMA